MERSVIVIGGGVAGLTAAHELGERGFTVRVLERKKVPGGKARSVPVPDSGTDGRDPLPGEHGFRFFPGFYRHVPDTMRRIPLPSDSTKSVFNNLVDTTAMEIAREASHPLVLLPRFPVSLEDFKVMLKGMHDAEDLKLGLTAEDLEHYAHRMWQILTSCRERRVEEYENIGWWTFLDAENRSQAYQDYLGEGMTRSLVAAKAKLASTKTVGDIGAQLLMNMTKPGVNSDRVLNGPTNEVWIEPWLAYLRSLGVRYDTNARVDSLAFDGSRVTGVNVEIDGKSETLQADHYVLAVPIEVAASLITPEMIAAAPALQGIVELREMTAWMNGAQFYLTEDVPLVHGHQIYLDSAWALTSLSQAQFWPDVDLRKRGDGQVAGILSVDISDWNAPATLPELEGKSAMECTTEELCREVWHQLKACLNTDSDDQVLKDSHLHSWFVDSDIVHSEHTGVNANLEPLLVNLVGSWKKRPESITAIDNLVLAGDYVRTHTDLATMEAANEAGRRAANGILERTGSAAHPAAVWDLHEPELLAPFRAHDRHRYSQGLPWEETTLEKEIEHVGEFVAHELHQVADAIEGHGENGAQGPRKRMSPAGRSLLVYGTYMISLAFLFILIPNRILPIFGFETETAAHPWVRVSAALIIALGYYYLVAARNELIPFMRATVFGRSSIVVVYTLLILVAGAPWELLLFAAPEALSAVWTFLALKRSEEASG